MLYSASIPSYSASKSKAEINSNPEVIDANDPKNKDKIISFLDSIN